MQALSKLTILLSTLLLTVTAAVPALAHLEKKLDLNGGHYDSFGYYHCHNAGCKQAPNRFDIIPMTRRNERDGKEFYNEDDWPYWLTTGGCQDMRTQVLVATSEIPVTWTNPRQCVVREGRWTDPYTGEVFERAARLEIDHIIPPAYANASNGYQWDDRTRAEFANDPLNLVPVSRDIHRKKRDRGIGTWRPPQEGFQCEYAAAWRDVSNKYDLDLFGRDKGRMNSILENCDIPERDFEDRGEKSKVDVRANGIPVPL